MKISNSDFLGDHNTFAVYGKDSRMRQYMVQSVKSNQIVSKSVNVRCGVINRHLLITQQRPFTDLLTI